jgi:hypothetical protein
VIPESLYKDPSFRQVAITLFFKITSLGKAMAKAVQLHRDTRFYTVEIQEVRTHGMLPVKLVSS